MHNIIHTHTHLRCASQNKTAWFWIIICSTADGVPDMLRIFPLMRAIHVLYNVYTVHVLYIEYMYMYYELETAATTDAGLSGPTIFSCIMDVYIHVCVVHVAKHPVPCFQIRQATNADITFNFNNMLQPPTKMIYSVTS